MASLELVCEVGNPGDGAPVQKALQERKSRDRQVCNLDVRYRVCLCVVLLIGCKIFGEEFLFSFSNDYTVLSSGAYSCTQDAVPRPYSSA